MKTHPTKVKLVFFDWQNCRGESVYNTAEGCELSMGDFHSGTTFTATIDLDIDQQADLHEALRSGHYPVFYVAREKE